MSEIKDPVSQDDTAPTKRSVRIQIPGIFGAPHVGAASLGAVGPQSPGIAGHTALRTVQQNDTLGWDTVFAVPVKNVNTAFAASRAYPESFDYTLNSPIINVNIKGKFGAWALTTGGSGGIVRMALPVSSGTFTPVGGQPIDMAGGKVTISVNLVYVPQPQIPENGTLNALRFNTQSQSGLYPVTVLQVELPASSDPAVLATASAAFETYLNQNLSAFTYVFNTINLNMVADKESFQWLKPTYSSYAYYDAASIDNAVFGVLCMVQDNEPGTAANQLGPMAIPPESQSGFSVSQPLFMKQMVLPGLPVAFGQNTTADDFKLLAIDTTIIANKQLPTAPVKYGAINYYPKIEQFRLWIDADMVCIYSKVHCHISAGIDAYYEETCYLSLQLVTKEDGTSTLGYVEAAPPNQNHWVDIANWIVITQVLIALLGAVISTIVGVLATTTARIVAACVIAVVMGAAAITASLVATIVGGGVADHLPSVEGLVIDMTNPVSWPDGTTFTPTLAQLNGTFQFGGNAFITA